MTRRSWFDRNRWRYPRDWEKIATAVKEAAGWRCVACGAPHGPPPHVLTVDHLDHDPSNCASENLLALCQRCHLTRQGLRPRPKTAAEALERLRVRREMTSLQLSLGMEVSVDDL